MSILIKGGRIIDPARGLDTIGNLFIEGTIIANQAQMPADVQVIDAAGLWVVPGLIDAHVHLREPGGEYKETLETGLKAAAAGGYTGVLPMPNTTPPNDSPTITRLLIDRAQELGGTRVYPVAAITAGRAGTEVGCLEDLARAGAVAFSDDGSGVDNSVVMEQALLRTKALQLPIAQHAEVGSLSAGGVVHAGDIASALQLPGWPAEAEFQMIERDIALSEKHGGKLHVCHISTLKGVELVRRAKQKGLPVTAEVTPHHLWLTDSQISNGGATQFKVNPPLRPQSNVEACRQGLADGTIDIVATDHAPHSADDKAPSFVNAAFGMVGLETAVPLILELVQKGLLTPLRMVEAMSTAPARIFGLPGGTLAPGAIADLTLIDPSIQYNVDSSKFLSKGRNTPFEGRSVTGRAVLTLVGVR